MGPMAFSTGFVISRSMRHGDCPGYFMEIVIPWVSADGIKDVGIYCMEKIPARKITRNSIRALIFR